MTPTSGPLHAAVLPGRGTVTVVGAAMIVAAGSPSRAVVQTITALELRDPPAAVARLEALVAATSGLGVAVASTAGWIVAAGPGIDLRTDHIGHRRAVAGPSAGIVAGVTRLVLAAVGTAVPHDLPVGPTANGTRSGAGVVIAGEEVLGTPAPSVEGIVCTSCGAFVHTLSVQCAACGHVIVPPRQLDRQPGVAVARIVLDDGRAMPLAGTVVIGRDPAAAPARGAQGAGTLVLDDAQRSVSRSHVVVHVDGWDVVVRDNNTANGTSVRPPSSGQWTALVPDTAVRLLPGTEVRLGRRTFRLLAND